ncbi:MAG: hypothetical protein ACRDJE_29785 [Dehalococcoidia bacterium]
MDHLGFALPILPGKGADARAFQRDLAGARQADYAHAERALGIVKELWFLQETPNGDLFIAYLESPDLNRALGRFAASRAAFDVWFRRQLADVTGIDLSIPPPGWLSELVSRYEAAV